MLTPAAAPTSPPISKTVPILRSTVLRLRCASKADTEDATIWFAPVATATAGGMPIKNNSGVIRNPPPTPNMPESTPTIPPSPKSRNALTEISAMGRYICICAVILICGLKSIVDAALPKDLQQRRAGQRSFT